MRLVQPALLDVANTCLRRRAAGRCFVQPSFGDAS